MGWLSGWSYRRPITWFNNSSTSLSPYVEQVILNSSNFDFSKVNSDGSDIRFTDADGTTVLNHWIEEWNYTGAYAVIWVEIPSITPYGGGTIYIYYGNPSATSNEVSPTVLFDFWADFTDLTGWTNFGTPSPAVFSDTSFHDGWGWASNGDSNYASGSYSTTTFSTSTSWRLIARAKQLAGNTWDMIYNIGFGNDTTFTEATRRMFANIRINGNNPDGRPEYSYDIYFGYYTSAGWVNVTTLSGANDLNYHRYQIIYDSPNNTVSFYMDETSQGSGSPDPPAVSAFPIVIAGRDYNNTNFLDYIGVVKSTGQAITMNVGSEETPMPVYVWDGTSWQRALAVKYWDGSQWVDAVSIKYWDGTQWVALS